MRKLIDKGHFLGFPKKFIKLLWEALFPLGAGPFVDMVPPDGFPVYVFWGFGFASGLVLKGWV